MTQQMAKEKRMDAYFKNPEPRNVTSCVVCLTPLSKERKYRYTIITCSSPCSYEWNRYQKKRADCNYKRSRKTDYVSNSKRSLISWKEKLLEDYNNAEKEARRVKSIRGNTDFKKEIQAYLEKGGAIKRLSPEKASKTYSANVETGRKKNMHDGFIPMEEDFNGLAYDIAAQT